MSQYWFSLLCFCCMWKDLTLPYSYFLFSSRWLSAFLWYLLLMASSSFHRSWSIEPSSSLIYFQQLDLICLTSSRWPRRQSLFLVMNSEDQRFRLESRSLNSASLAHFSCNFQFQCVDMSLSMSLRYCSLDFSSMYIFSSSARSMMPFLICLRLFQNYLFISCWYQLRSCSYLSYIFAISRLPSLTILLIQGSIPFSVVSVIYSSFLVYHFSLRYCSAFAHTSLCFLQSSQKESFSFLRARSMFFRLISSSSLRVISSSFSFVNFSAYSSCFWHRYSSILIFSASSVAILALSWLKISSCDATSLPQACLRAAMLSSCMFISNCRVSQLPLTSMMRNLTFCSSSMSSRYFWCFKSISLAQFSMRKSFSFSMGGCSSKSRSMFLRFSARKDSRLPFCDFSFLYFAIFSSRLGFISNDNNDHSSALLQLRQDHRAQVGGVLRAGGRAR